MVSSQRVIVSNGGLISGAYGGHFLTVSDSINYEVYFDKIFEFFGKLPDNRSFAGLPRASNN